MSTAPPVLIVRGPSAKAREDADSAWLSLLPPHGGSPYDPDHTMRVSLMIPSFRSISPSAAIRTSVR
jgi:hypothetical protein